MRGKNDQNVQKFGGVCVPGRRLTKRVLRPSFSKQKDFCIGCENSICIILSTQSANFGRHTKTIFIYIPWQTYAHFPLCVIVNKVWVSKLFNQPNLQAGQATKHNLKQVKLLEQLNTTHADCRFIWYSSPTLWPSFDVMMTLWNLKVASIIRFGQMQMHRQPKQASNHHQRDQHLPLPAFWSDKQDSLFWVHCWHFAVSYRHIIFTWLCEAALLMLTSSRALIFYCRLCPICVKIKLDAVICQ